MTEAADATPEWTGADWRVVEDDGGYLNVHQYDDQGYPEKQIGDIICTVFQDEPFARLIGAAPDLYEALKTARHQVKLFARDSDEIAQAVLATCDAALALAAAKPPGDGR